MSTRFILILCFSFIVQTSLANTQVADLFDDTISPHNTNGFISYGNIDKQRLDQLVTAIGEYRTDGRDKNDVLAFYINAYNSLAVKGIADGYGPHSLLSRYRFFKGNAYLVAGKTMNLDTLEHKIIRPLQEPRIHFALVCAAASCPALRGEAYRADTLNEQLNNQATIFINNKEKNSFDIKQKQANISSIFKWFEEDFLLKEKSLSEYIANFVNDEAIKLALKQNQFKVSFNDYNWSLNGSR